MDDDIKEPRRGCKYAFGCALLVLFLLVITWPWTVAILLEEARSFGF